MHEPQPDLLHILRVLAAQHVDFIVVGGVCAVLHGAPVTTFDLDLVHSRDPHNIMRLMTALSELDARYRDPAGRLLRPTGDGLRTTGHHLLITTGGPLDLLGEIAGSRDYTALLPSTITFVISDDLRLRVLSLEALIEIKEMLGRDKDKVVLAILRRTRDMKTSPNAPAENGDS